MDKEFGLTVQLSVGNPVQLTDSSLKIFLFRAVQELLHNIARHSGVKSARVILSDAADVVTITVSDEGKGFHPEELRGAIEKSRLGIASLRERTRAFGGTLSIESTPGSGSSFTLTRASA